MNPKQKRTLLTITVINSFFEAFEDEERTKTHKLLQARIGKGLRKTYKQFGEEEVRKILVEEYPKLWSEILEHFGEELLTVDATLAVNTLIDLEEGSSKEIVKKYGMNPKMLENWSAPTMKHKDVLTIEGNTRDVAKYIYKEITLHCGLEELQKESVLERIARHKKGI